MARPDLLLQRYRRATERATEAIAQLGVLADEPARLHKLVGRVELFLWKFLRLRWHDVHRFFSSVEPIEVDALVKEPFEAGKVFDFFSERQDLGEWENCMTVGLSLVFAAMRQAAERGFDPKHAGVFTLQRMLEQVIEQVDDLEDLLERGAPP
jgi:hypothetical protein